MKYVLNNCKAGKAAQDYLAKTFKDNQKKFASTEKKLKEQESNLLAKKNDLNYNSMTVLQLRTDLF